MSDWDSFLLSQGAFCNSQGLAEIAHPTISPDATYLMPLQNYGLLAVNGIEASKFLQGQVTCDVRELENHKSLLGAQCNIKGRMLLCFRALQTNSEQILLRMDKNLVANGLSSLGKYIVFFKAKLVNVSEEYRCVGIAGANAKKIITNELNVHLAENGEWQMCGNSIIIRISDERFECWFAASDAESLWKKLAPHCLLAGQNLWTLLNIQAGLGDITTNTLETFTPQAINFQLVDGINFRKGCYTGQEIVARLHYRGNLKRHMYRFEFNLQENTLPIAGSELLNSDGKTVGEVIMSAQKTTTAGELLASVVDDQRIDIFIPQNPQKLSLLSLPYAIPIADDAN